MPDPRHLPFGRHEGAMIRAASMEGFSDLLLELHTDPTMILLAAGLDSVAIGQPERVIPTTSFRTALNMAAEATGLAHFGLLLSQRQTFEKLGAVGYLVRHAPNLAASIERLILHFRTHDTGSMTQLDVTGDVVLWTHGLSGVADESGIQQTELALGLACRFVRSALHETWSPDAVYFEHSAPRDVRPYERVFRCPIHFEQAITGIEFPSSDLARPLRLSDPGLFAILESHVKQIEEGLVDDFPTKVKLTIQQNIEGRSLRIEHVASLIGMKRHTLQRRLKRHDTSYQCLLDDVRFELGRRYLRETGMPVSEIADILGYAEPAVFTRAFSRRAGTTPRQWRQGQRKA